MKLGFYISRYLPASKISDMFTVSCLYFKCFSGVVRRLKSIGCSPETCAYCSFRVAPEHQTPPFSLSKYGRYVIILVVVSAVFRWHLSRNSRFRNTNANNLTSLASPLYSIFVTTIRHPINLYLLPRQYLMCYSVIPTQA